jgi:hypothetical protein
VGWLFKQTLGLETAAVRFLCAKIIGKCAANGP